MKPIRFYFVLAWLAASAIFFANTPPALEKNESAFLFISDEMKQFLDKHVAITPIPKERLNLLVQAIFDRSLLDFAYSNNKTYTAEETFKHRTGNCLSYTAMFVVMARYAGLPANFQEVYSFSHWTKRENMVVFNRHINAVVAIEGRQLEVDFDFSTDNRLREVKVISDRRAEAHYYNNIGAEALIGKNYAQAESLLKKAIQKDEGFSPAWTNLGLLYQYTGKMKLAERTYKKSISVDKHNFSAQVNLSNLYKNQGYTEKAKKLLKQIERHCRKNPFYHYSLGQYAFNEAKFEMAIGHYKQAIKRNSKEPEFYVKLAASYYKLGNYTSAEKYLKKAGKLAKSSQQRNLYKRKLDYLYSHSYHQK
jgi:tetratricopeptide (TPR) repeat protein